MAKRGFALPGIEDLSKEQEAARALPKEGQHLIVGGPGTGKTVITLIRGRRHQRDEDEHHFLVWNHLLQRSTAQLAGSLSSTTWEKWFGDQIEKITEQPLPRKPANQNGYRPVDWSAVAKLTAGRKRIPDPPYLVIDEGQDMPPQFFRALVALGFERFFVAADQNQQITDSHSSRSDIETALAVETADVMELRYNYRNTTPIAKLARVFYTGDPASPPPELPHDRPGVAPWLVSYPDDRFQDICKRIVLLVDRDPKTLVGVIAPDNKVRKRYFDGLRAVRPKGLDDDLPRIETFHGSHRPDFPFDEGGILVINVQTCKGLEFDVVVLADIDCHHFRPDDPDSTRKRFYVMVARAQKQVILLRRQRDRNRLYPIDPILPNDPEMLQRRELELRARSGADVPVHQPERCDSDRQQQEREGKR